MHFQLSYNKINVIINSRFILCLCIILINLAISFFFAFTLKSADKGFPKGSSYIYSKESFYEFGDYHAYNKFAYSLLKDGQFKNPLGKVSAYVTPGYPVFLAFIYSIFGFNYIVVVIFQSVLLSFSYFLLFKYISQTFGNKPAFIALVLLLMNIKFSLYTAQVMSETLFLFLIALVFYLIRYVNANRSYKLYILGLVIGYGILVRPVLIPCALIIIAYLIYIKIRLKRFVLLLFFASILPTLWILRNYHYFDKFLISTNSAATIPLLAKEPNFEIFYNYEMSDFLNNDSSNFVRPLGISDKEWFPFFNGYRYDDPFMLGNEVSNKIDLLRLFKRTIYLIHVAISPFTGDMSKRNKIISTFLWLLTILPVFIYIIKKRKDIRVWAIFLCGFSLILMPSMLVIDTNLRYQLPMQFVFTILASCFWNSIIPFRKNNA